MSVCWGIIAAALTLANNIPISRPLVAATVLGAIGSSFAMVTLSCEHGHTGHYFVMMSVVCSASGTVCVVAALKEWAATLFTGACISMTLSFVGWLRSCER